MTTEDFMETLRTKTVIGPDGKVKIEVPTLIRGLVWTRAEDWGKWGGGTWGAVGIECVGGGSAGGGARDRADIWAAGMPRRAAGGGTGARAPGSAHGAAHAQRRSRRRPGRTTVSSAWSVSRTNRSRAGRTTRPNWVKL